MKEPFEQKYVFQGPHKSAIQDWIESFFIPDPFFHFGAISTLYYDTPGFELYWEKCNSDYLKSKVRLRWYEKLDELAQDSTVTCYLEFKQKRGAKRFKARKKIFLPLTGLQENPFEDEEVINLPLTLSELVSVPVTGLVPMLLIQYDRQRFIDPQSGSRIALDTNIRCTGANQKFVSVVTPVLIDNGVLEIKGEGRGLLPCLNHISGNLTKESFSKYSYCYELLQQPAGRRV